MVYIEVVKGEGKMKMSRKIGSKMKMEGSYVGREWIEEMKEEERKLIMENIREREKEKWK